MRTIEKIKEFMKDERGNAILMLVAMAIGILILIVIVTLVPPVAYNVQNSVTVSSGEWSSQNAGFTNGSEMWAQLSPMMGTTALVAVVGVLISVLLGALAMRRQ